MRNQKPSKKATVISIGSGKGGVGKSVVATNLALIFAGQGKRVVIVDLDIGGANVHVLFGQFNPGVTLEDFFNRKVESLNDVTIRLPGLYDLKIIVGAGETLKSANLHYAKKRRLIRSFRNMDADVVFVDVGPGTNYHSLDFFLLGDFQVAVTTADPASIVDVYRFIKLAAIRKGLSPFLQRDLITTSVAEQEFTNIDHVLSVVEQIDPESRVLVSDAVAGFNPCLVLNRISKKYVYNVKILQSLIKEYIGKELNVLGSIPDDEAVAQSIRNFIPVFENTPRSPAAVALGTVARSLSLLLEMRAVE